MAGPRKPRSPYRIRDGQRSLAPRPRAERVLEARRVLRGERVLLRPLASTDLRRCVKWFSDPQIIRFLGRDAPVTLAEEERWFRDYERRTDEQIFAIEGEGVHREDIYKDGRFVNVMRMSILARELREGPAA